MSEVKDKGRDASTSDGSVTPQARTESAASPVSETPAGPGAPVKSESSHEPEMSPTLQPPTLQPPTPQPPTPQAQTPQAPTLIAARRAPERQVSKLCSFDAELGNFVTGPGLGGGTGAYAARALLAEVGGVRPRRGSAYGSTYGGASYSYGGAGYGGSGYGYGYGSGYSSGYGSTSRTEVHDAAAWGRTWFSSNGSCVYEDMGHLELAGELVENAADFVAMNRAMLRTARAAQIAVNDSFEDDTRIVVLVNNSDGLGHAYGSHLNFLVTREAWDDVMERKPHQLAWLASFQVSSIVFTGQGKVGTENHRAPADYVLSQRACHFETMQGAQTTTRRPIVNARDEALSGNGQEAGSLARLHAIFFDQGLAQTATFLRAGTMQIVLAMLEAGDVDPTLIVDDPLVALQRWNRDLTFTDAVRMADGSRATAVDVQRRFLASAEAAFSAGHLDVVPLARKILDEWGGVLDLLACGDLDALVGKLDWVLKRRIIEGAMTGDVDWDSPRLKQLDHLYASIDPADGIFWGLEADGLVERVVDEAAVDRFFTSPPEGTRAWTRAHLLRDLGDARLEEMDWDRLTIAGVDSGGRYRRVVVHMDDPRAFTRSEVEEVLTQVGDNAVDRALAVSLLVPPDRHRAALSLAPPTRVLQ